MSNTRKRASSTPEFTNLEKALAAIGGAKLPRKSVALCLRGDLVAQLDELERKLRETPTPDRLTGSAENRATATRIEELREEMQDSTVVFTLEALPRRAFQKFVAEHGPRDGNAEDKAAGINTETYFVDLVRKCLREPDLTDEQFEALIDEALAMSQWRELSEAAVNLNIEVTTVPFSPAASLVLRNSGTK